jgi:hypothetical protein
MGRFTMKSDTLFAHITDTNIGQYYLQGMKGKISQGLLLFDGREIFIGPYWHGKRSYIDKDNIFFNDAVVAKAGRDGFNRLKVVNWISKRIGNIMKWNSVITGTSKWNRGCTRTYKNG